MNGRSIVVTGGASGIGRAVVELLCRSGSQVMIADSDAETGSALAATLSAQGAVRFVHADVSDEASVGAMVDATVAAFGRLDGAVNAAAVVLGPKLLHEFNSDEWDRCFAVNLRGMFLCVKYEIAAMLAAGGGAIVNIAATAGQAALPFASAYCTSKSGVLGLVRAAAVDYARLGIRINAVMPAGTRSPSFMKTAGANPDFERQVVAFHPMGRIAEPAEIAGIARWLLSDEASFVTGAAYAVDGGNLAAA